MYFQEATESWSLHFEDGSRESTNSQEAKNVQFTISETKVGLDFIFDPWGENP